MIELDLKEQLETERLILRIPEATFDNAQIQFATCDRNREHLRPYMNWISKTNVPEDSFGFLKHVQEDFKEGKKAEYWIVEKSTGDFCGLCSIHLHDGLYEYGEIGYWQDEKKCGKGYITEAVKAIENNYFAQGLNRIEIRNDVENTPSINIPKRLGYHLDGVLRGAGSSDYFKGPRDINVWSKLLAEWQKTR